jgi:hypothetical protein
VLNKFALKHVVVQFFRETLDISYDAFTQDIMTRWQGSAPPPLTQIERTMTQVCLKLRNLAYVLKTRQILIANIKSLWYNPPRRRRFCAKSLFDWHELFVVFMDVCVRLAPLVSATDVSNTL